MMTCSLNELRLLGSANFSGAFCRQSQATQYHDSRVAHRWCTAGAGATWRLSIRLFNRHNKMDLSSKGLESGIWM